MTTPQISGIHGGTQVLQGRLQTFVDTGVAATLPLELDNGVIRLRFVAHAAYGVVLESLTHLEDLARNGATFPWAVVAGPLWRLVTQPGRGWSDGWSAGFGGGLHHVEQPATVSVTETEDAEGRPAVMLRWADVDLPEGGTVDVTALVSLGFGERVSRWLIAATRDGEQLDSLERIDFPLLEFVAPVATRAGLTHTQSQARCQVLLPASAMPDLLGVNAPLSQWAGRELVTHHPTGEAGTPAQPLQFEALCAVDPDDTASFRRVLYLGTADFEGHHKQTWRAGASRGESATWQWAHRWFPRWAPRGATDLTDASRFGNTFEPAYAVLVGCIEAPTAAWWATARAMYRDLVADRMAPPPKRTDAGRSGLARGEPLISATRQEVRVYGAALGAQFRTWANELLAMTGATSGCAQIDQLDPDRDLATPALAHDQVRGTNYLPMCSSWSHSVPLSWLPMREPDSSDRPVQPTDGWYLERLCREELQEIAARGLNNIRILGSLTGYACDPAAYLQTLRSISGLCQELGLTITYQLFSTTPSGYAAYLGIATRSLCALTSYNGPALRALLWGLADDWQAFCFEGNTVGAPWGLPAGEVDLTFWPEPCTKADWLALGRFGEWSETQYQDIVRSYVRDVASFFAVDPVGQAAFQSYDIYNEADINFDDDEVRDHVMHFCASVGTLIHTIHDGAALTVGWTVGGAGLSTELEREHGLRLGYVSLHGYATSEPAWTALAAFWAQGKAEAQALGVPLVLSEWVVLPENVGEVHRYSDLVTALGAGGQAWSILRNNAYRPPLSPSTDARILDGLLSCRTPAQSVTSQQYGHAWSDGFGDGFGGPGLRFETVYPVDLATIEAWAQT